MTRYFSRDLKLTPDGDLALTPGGDLALAEGADFIQQSAYNRLRSVTVDWFYDHIGADLEDFIGQPNSRETADRIVAQLTNSLVQDGLVSSGDVYIRPVPVDKSNILLFVFINTPYADKPLGFEVAVGLQGGVSVKSA